jgi:predicted DNA-binding transcriptional regulator YafY
MIGIAESFKSLLNRTEQTAPQIDSSFQASDLDQEDEVDSLIDFEVQDNWPKGTIGMLEHDLWGMSFAIHYRDSKGQESTRRITLHNLYLLKNHHLMMTARCHERGASRSFRVDRIDEVIDLDGIIYNVEEFFRDQLHLDMSGLATTPDLETISMPGNAQKAQSKVGLVLLVAFAKSDQFLDDQELLAIMNYVEDEAYEASIPIDDEDYEALISYVRRLRPPDDLVLKALHEIKRWPSKKQNRFLKAAKRVVLADGVVTEEEAQMWVDFVDWIEDRAS